MEYLICQMNLVENQLEQEESTIIKERGLMKDQGLSNRERALNEEL